MDAYADGDGRRSDADRLYITTQGLDYRLLIELPILSDPTNSGQICMRTVALPMFRGCHFCVVPEHAGSSLIQPCSELIYGTRPPLPLRTQASHPLPPWIGCADDMTDSYVRMPTDCMINP